MRSAVEESLVADTTVLKKVVNSTASSIASSIGTPIKASLLLLPISRANRVFIETIFPVESSTHRKAADLSRIESIKRESGILNHHTILDKISCFMIAPVFWVVNEMEKRRI
jgi:hypothetical protein